MRSGFRIFRFLRALLGAGLDFLYDRQYYSSKAAVISTWQVDSLPGVCESRAISFSFYSSRKPGTQLLNAWRLFRLSSPRYEAG
jgi:hypothetical protein